MEELEELFPGVTFTEIIPGVQYKDTHGNVYGKLENEGWKFFPKPVPRTPPLQIISHYIVETRECYLEELYKAFTNGTTCWKYMYYWEEEVYDAIKDFKEPVYYKGADAKEHFKELKISKVRPESAWDAWRKRHNEILKSCEEYEGMH